MVDGREPWWKPQGHGEHSRIVEDYRAGGEW
jgi:hypothetical protein